MHFPIVLLFHSFQCPKRFITARKRSLRRLCFYRFCHSFRSPIVFVGNHSVNAVGAMGSYVEFDLLTNSAWLHCRRWQIPRAEVLYRRET